MRRSRAILLLTMTLSLVVVALREAVTMAAAGARIQKDVFGKGADQKPIDIYTLTNARGVEARIMTYGGIVVSLKAPDRNGKLDDVVLGYDDLEGYLRNNSPHFGAIIGRYGNRIAKGIFALAAASIAKCGAFSSHIRPNHNR